MSHAHPVERTVGRTRRRVHVIVPIDVEQSNWIRRDTTKSGDHAKRNCAVPAQDEQYLVAGQQRDKACNQVTDTFGDLVDVLRSGTRAIRMPDLKGQITFVMHFQSHGTKSANEPGRPQCGRCLILASGIAAGATRNPDYRDGSHSRDCRWMQSRYIGLMRNSPVAIDLELRGRRQYS